MKTAIYILLAIVTVSCNSNGIEESCNLSQVDAKNSITVIDSLERFSLIFPSAEWDTNLSIEEGSQIIGCDSVNGIFLCLSVGESLIDSDWLGLDAFQQVFLDEYDPIESGHATIDDRDAVWNIVSYPNQEGLEMAIYYTVEYPENGFFYTIGASCGDASNPVEQLCRLRPYLESFKLTEKAHNTSYTPHPLKSPRAAVQKDTALANGVVHS
jgi:hypothetical protein